MTKFLKMPSSLPARRSKIRNRDGWAPLTRISPGIHGRHTRHWHRGDMAKGVRSSAGLGRSDEALQVFDLLRTSILSGELGGVGTPLPPEYRLISQFGVGRNVMREALAGLGQEGLVERVRGSGTFIVASKLKHGFSTLRAVGSDLDDRHRRISGEILRSEHIGAPDVIAGRLGVRVGELLRRVEVRTLLDGEPFWLTTSYFRPDLAGIINFVVRDGDWYRALEALGHVLGNSEVTTEAITASTGVGKLLSVNEGAPLFRFERIISDGLGRPLELGFVRCRGDKVALNQRLERLTPNRPNLLDHG